MLEGEMILAVASLIVEHGVPAAMSIIQTWDKAGAPTLEDIRALRTLRPAASYFDHPETAA